MPASRGVTWCTGGRPSGSVDGAGDDPAESQVDDGGQSEVEEDRQLVIIRREQVTEDPGQGVRHIRDEVDERVAWVGLEQHEDYVEDQEERGNHRDDPNDRGQAVVPATTTPCRHD